MGTRWMQIIAVILAGSWMLVLTGVDADSYSDIADYIFENYDKQTRPFPNHTDPVDVQVQITVQHISAVDPTRQELTSTIQLTTQWKDKRLAFRPLPGINVFVLDENLLWMPDLYITNAVSPVKRIYGGRVIVHPDGGVFRHEYLSLITSCSVLDDNDQLCEYRVGNLYVNGLDVMLSSAGCTNEDFVLRDWNVNSTKNTIDVIRYPCCSELYPVFKCSITLSKLTDEYGLYDEHLSVATNIAMPHITMLVVFFVLYFYTN